MILLLIFIVAYAVFEGVTEGMFWNGVMKSGSRLPERNVICRSASPGAKTA